MKLHLIYLSIGILTFVLNLLLSLHMIRKRNSTRQKNIMDCEDVITFSLKREKGKEPGTTETVLCEDTVVLQ